MVQGYRDFVLEYDGWLLVVGLALVLGFFMVYQHRGVVARKKCIRKRRSLSENEWFDAYYPVAPGKRDLVRDVLSALAEEIGVEWTKLRPADTFEETLRVERRYSLHDDLEEAGLEIASLAERLGLAERTLPGFTGALGDFLDRWISLCNGEPTGQSTAVAAN